MREIKFRAWDKNNKGFINGFNMIGFSKGQGSPVKKLKRFDTNWDEDDFELMQYTGLKDCNGKDVYEGDIVEAEGFKPSFFKIEFLEGGFCATDIKNKDEYPIDINLFYPSIGCRIEVIGNIYEIKK